MLMQENERRSGSAKAARVLLPTRYIESRHTERNGVDSLQSVDNARRCMVLSKVMNEVQQKIDELEKKGWTLAAIARSLSVTTNAVEKWKAGDRYPHTAALVIDALDQLLKRKRIPKRKQYGLRTSG